MSVGLHLSSRKLQFSANPVQKDASPSGDDKATLAEQKPKPAPVPVVLIQPHKDQPSSDSDSSSGSEVHPPVHRSSSSQLKLFAREIVDNVMEFAKLKVMREQSVQNDEADHTGYDPSLDDDTDSGDDGPVAKAKVRFCKDDIDIDEVLLKDKGSVLAFKMSDVVSDKPTASMTDSLGNVMVAHAVLHCRRDGGATVSTGDSNISVDSAARIPQPSRAEFVRQLVTSLSDHVQSEMREAILKVTQSGSSPTRQDMLAVREVLEDAETNLKFSLVPALEQYIGGMQSSSLEALLANTVIQSHIEVRNGRPVVQNRERNTSNNNNIPAQVSSNIANKNDNAKTASSSTSSTSSFSGVQAYCKYPERSSSWLWQRFLPPDYSHRFENQSLNNSNVCLNRRQPSVECGCRICGIIEREEQSRLQGAGDQDQVSIHGNKETISRNMKVITCLPGILITQCTM